MLFPPRDFFSSQIRPVDELIFRKILEADRARRNERRLLEEGERHRSGSASRYLLRTILRSRFSLSLVRCNVTSTQLPSRDACTDDLTVAGTADTSIYGDIDNHTDLTAPISRNNDRDRLNLVSRRERERERNSSFSSFLLYIFSFKFKTHRLTFNVKIK